MYPLAIYVAVLALVGVGVWVSVRFRWAERSAASVRSQLAELSDSISARLPATTARYLVNRRPATGSLDSWPSGGVGPAFLIFGLIAYFFLQTMRARYRMRVILWATLGVVVGTEAYTRVYLLKYWASDVMPGGLLFGAALLFVWASAAWLLDRGSEATAPPPKPDHVDWTEARSENVSVADPLGV